MALYKTDADKNLIKITGGANRQLPLGAVFCSAVILNDPAYKRLDGQCIPIDGIYAQFCQYILNASTADVPKCTIAEYGEDLTNYGQCGKFVVNTSAEVLIENGAYVEANSIKLPTITAFIESTNNTYKIGTAKEAGLPNIKGRVDNYTYFSGSEGAFYTETISTSGGASTGTGNYKSRFRMDASRSSSVYGKSETVQPKSVSYPYYIVVATSTKLNIETDLDNYATELNNKVNKDLSNAKNSTPANVFYGNMAPGESGLLNFPFTNYRLLIISVRYGGDTGYASVTTVTPGILKRCNTEGTRLVLSTDSKWCSLWFPYHNTIRCRDSSDSTVRIEIEGLF